MYCEVFKSELSTVSEHPHDTESESDCQNGAGAEYSSRYTKRIPLSAILTYLLPT